MAGAGDAARPAPLQLSALPQVSALERELVLPDWCCEVPVRRTFIDYRWEEDTPRLSLSRSLSGLSTAPASLAGSVRESLDEVTSFPVRHLQNLTSSCAAEADAGSAASSARRSMASSASTSATLPLVSYRMSPISARAAGLMQERCDQTDESAKANAVSRTERAEDVARIASSGSTDEDCESSGDEDDEDLGLCPIYTEGAELPSAGSAGHGEGSCRRCCFFPKGRCNNGQDCQFCHFAHDKRKGKNKKKKNKKRSGRRGRQGAAVQEGDGKTEGAPTPVNIVLQDAIPLEESTYQPQSYSVAFVPVPFCVGVF